MFLKRFRLFPANKAHTVYMLVSSNKARAYLELLPAITVTNDLGLVAASLQAMQHAFSYFHGL